MGDGRTVGEVGEFGLIAELQEALPPAARGGQAVALAIGDDAAVWAPTAGERVVATADALIEGVHFRLDWTGWRDLGHKTLAVNASDIAAMGAAPRVALVTLGLRGDERVEDLRELYRGLGGLAARLGIVVAGGDIVRSPRARVLHATVLGETRGERVLTRGGARPGDLVAVSGTLGASAAGLRLLATSGDDPRRSAATAPLLIDAHRRPQPRLALGAVLRDRGATAAMDLSDGLLGDLPKILAASNVAARIDAGRIPVAAAVRALFPDEWFDLATRGGEDYELLFTVPPTAWPVVAEASVAAGASVTAIGEVVAPHPGGALVMTGLDGAEHAVAIGAFDHFAG